MSSSQLSNPSVTGPTTVTSSAQVSTTKTPEGTALDPGDPEFAAKALKNAAELAKGMAAPGPDHDDGLGECASLLGGQGT